MNIQDKLERILRDLHIMLSRAQESEHSPEYVLIRKKEMQAKLGSISEAVREMMEAYEITEQSRNRGELEAEKRRMEIMRDAGRQAEDIYAASVIYTDDALGRILDIIDAAERSSREVLKQFSREMAEERRTIRSNQLELITQLGDMKDTAKYMRLIEERNREIAKEKAKKQDNGTSRDYRRGREREAGNTAVTPEIKINREYFEKAGLSPDGLLDAQTEGEANAGEETASYEKPVIKVNQEYFRKREQTAQEVEEAGEESKEERQKFFSFGRKS